MSERRENPRKPVEVFFNKYVGGYPHLCRALDISRTGVQAVNLGQPETHMQSFSLELRLPGEKGTFWLWARRVRSEGRREALEFVATSPEDEHRLERFVATYRAA